MFSVNTGAVGLSIVGFWLLGRAAIDWHRFGKRRPTGLAWLFVLASPVVRFVFDDGAMAERAVLAGRDLGFGLLLAGVWQHLESTPGRTRMLLGLVAVGFWFWRTRLPAEHPARVQSVVEILVELGPDDRVDEIADTLRAHDATWEIAFPSVTLSEDEDLAQFLLVRCPSEMEAPLLAALRKSADDVDSASPNGVFELEPPEAATIRSGRVGTNDPRASEQWSLEAAGVNDMLDALRRVEPTRVAQVAIIDTGVDEGHEDITGAFTGAGRDVQGHGTHCAGIAGAPANNAIGIASPNLGGKFLAIRSYAALGDNGSGTHESIAQAIVDAVEAGADVLSMSLGGYSPTPPKVLVEAVEFAVRRGAIVIVAAGNDGGDDAKEHSPANVPGVIVVGASAPDGGAAPFSNHTTSLAMPIAAPGQDILSLATGGGYVSMSGTSMATPLVAGVVGVLRSIEPKLTTERAWHILRDTGTEGPSAALIGRTIHAGRALQAIR